MEGAGLKLEVSNVRCLCWHEVDDGWSVGVDAWDAPAENKKKVIILEIVCAHVNM